MSSASYYRNFVDQFGLSRYRHDIPTPTLDEIDKIPENVNYYIIEPRDLRKLSTLIRNNKHGSISYEVLERIPINTGYYIVFQNKRWQHPEFVYHWHRWCQTYAAENYDLNRDPSNMGIQKFIDALESNHLYEILLRTAVIEFDRGMYFLVLRKPIIPDIDSVSTVVRRSERAVRSR